MEELERLIQERLDKLTDAQRTLLAIAQSVQQGLYDAIILQYDDILKDFTKFYTLYAQFASTEALPLIQQVVTTLRNVQTWNEDYFVAQQISRTNQINQVVERRLLSAFGLTEQGATINGGYIDGLMKNPRVSNNVGNFLVRESIMQRAKPVALRELSTLVRGNDTTPGQYSLLLDQDVFDRLQEADRLTQTVYAEELDLQAAFYSGGKIDGSREFCRVRASKIFTRDEISKFGTSADTYGGYTDKAAGKFAGKPAQYNPFFQMGGYSCRHSYGWVTNRVAMRYRSDLKEVNGILQLA